MLSPYFTNEETEAQREFITSGGHTLSPQQYPHTWPESLGLSSMQMLFSKL